MPGERGHAPANGAAGDDFARQQTTDSAFETDEMGREVTNDTFAGLPPGEADRARAQRDRLQQPLLVERPPGENAEADANPLSKAFLFFMRRTQRKAEKLDADIDIEHLDRVVEEDRAEHNYAAFAEVWARMVAEYEAALVANPNADKDAIRPSVVKALLLTHKATLVALAFFMLIEIAFPFATPVLLTYINEFVVDKDAPLWHGGVFAVIFFFCQIFQTLGQAQANRLTSHLEIRYEGAMRIAMARRALMLTPDGFEECGGQNATFQLFGGDVQRAAAITQAFGALGLCVQVFAAFVYLFVVSGWPAIGPLAVFCIVMPLNYRASSKFMDVAIAKFFAGDARTKKVVEIINAIRTVKFYAWERPFVKLVAKLREPELMHTQTMTRLIAAIMFSFAIASPLMQLALFVILVGEDPNALTVTKFFQAVSLVGILSNALVRLPFMYSTFLQTRIASDRLGRMLIADARELPVRTSDPGNGRVAIDGATFAWSTQDAARFRDEAAGKAKQGADGSAPFGDADEPQKASGSRLVVEDFEVAPGELALVVGKLGSGKSALVKSILGETVCVAGNAKLTGRVAYTPQTAWVINATIRNNIIMQNDYDAERYYRVVRAVDLHVDFQALPNGDLTEIGEKGINLSGGQKQRVSLARALYMDADVYIFDDPLSALDAHVGRHVFDAAILGLLKGKTRILVTHALGFLGAADRVYVADNMRITRVEDIPSMAALGATPEPAGSGVAESALVQLLRAWHGSKGTDEEAEAAADEGPMQRAATDGDDKASSTATKTNKKKKEKMSGTLTVQEERLSGHVSNRTIFVYFQSFGGALFWIWVIMLYAVSVAATIYATLWLGQWAGNEQPQALKDANFTPTFYVGMYALLIVFAAFLVLFREWVWSMGAVNAPRQMYKRMSDAVFCTTMAFFDTTPVGRIINRFTKDAETLDFGLPLSANTVFNFNFLQFGTLVAICVVLPWFTPVAVLLIFAMYHMQPTVATVVLRRLANSLSGPMVALFSETVTGAACLRAADLGDFAMRRFAQTIDDNNAGQLADLMLFNMVFVNVGITMSFVAGALIVVLTFTKDSMTPATASFAVSYGMNLAVSLGFALIMRGQLALALNSVERLNEFAELPPEPEGDQQPPKEWPEKGAIELQHVHAQYRPGQPVVLRDVSVSIKGGEKIGVCGRTGSGKSSLLLTLFRLIPLIRESRLLIDGVDTSTISLFALRSKLSAIPQEPVLFSGTVRDNIDPFGAVPRAALIEALERCHLREKLEAKAEESVEEKKQQKAQLQMMVAAMGPNAPAALKQQAEPSPEDDVVPHILDLELQESSLSNGEKQLLCLARALARNQRILVLDEATSSVDPHTDQLIQKTIRSAFSHCTVITVAHRLNTIMDSDRILVLDNGRVAEFDTPAVLKAKPHGVFARLVADAERGDEA